MYRLPDCCLNCRPYHLWYLTLVYLLKELISSCNIITSGVEYTHTRTYPGRIHCFCIENTVTIHKGTKNRRSDVQV